MTTAVDELDLPGLDALDPALGGPRFHDVLAELRAQGWLARARPVGFAVLDREAVAFFLRTSAATFPGRRMLEFLGVTSGPLHERAQGTLLDLDGDDHRRLRRLVQPAFTPAAADRRRPAIRALLAELFAPLADVGRADAVAALAAPLPALVIAELMGAPREDAPRLGRWANLVQRQFDPVALTTMRADLEEAAAASSAYARELLRARQGDPGDDLISELIAVGHPPEVGRTEGDRLSEDECVNLVTAVLVGGVDTTQAQLAHGLRLFAEHPEQWRALADDPAGLAPAAAEEVLRHEPITPFTARVVLEDLEFRDVRFPAGTLVLASAATANREAGGDAFDITAPRDRARPLTFGAGPHFCLGANLARAELQEAFAFLAPRMPGLALDGEPVYEHPAGVYGMGALPVRWDRQHP